MNANPTLPFPLEHSLPYQYFCGMKAEIFSPLNRYYTWEKYGKPLGRKETDEECHLNYFKSGAQKRYDERFRAEHQHHSELRAA